MLHCSQKSPFSMWVAGCMCGSRPVDLMCRSAILCVWETFRLWGMAIRYEWAFGHENAVKHIVFMFCMLSQ